MSHRKRSSVWMYFSLETNSKSRCNICNKIISFKSGSTNNLHRHLKTQHINAKIKEVKIEPNCENEVESVNTFASPLDTQYTSVTVTETTATPALSVATEPSSTPEQTSFFNYVPPPALTPSRQGEIDEELAKMIATDFQPIKIVEDRGFESFCYALNPSYVLPCRGLLTQKLYDMYEREVEPLKRRLSGVSAVCLTMDCWTSQATSFMSVTCHFIEDFHMSSCLLDCFEFNEWHTVDNLANNLLSVAAEWGVDNKVECCLTDNSPNIEKAIQATGWTHLPCLAHTINLVVRNSLNGPQPIINKVKEAVEYFHRSPAGEQQLKEAQVQMQMDTPPLKRDCATRWNSTYYMLQSFLANKDPIVSTLAVTNEPVHPLFPEEWIALQEICNILKPFEEVTAELSAESYMTASKVILLVRGLQRAMADFHRRVTTQAALDVVSVLSSGMSARFHRIESNHILADAAALDPRFQRMAFVDGGTADEAFQRVSTAAAGIAISSREPNQLDSGASESIVWNYFYEEVAETKPSRNLPADSVTEVRGYLQEPLLPKNKDPLQWWKSRSSVYPRLSRLVAKKLCVVATSVPAERLFSKTGELFAERRSRLKPATVKSLIFLNGNLPKDKKERP